jgi:hypothetical protein
VARVLVACESSGVVRDAFRARGHAAYSCDILPADDGSEHHIQGDALAAALEQPWQFGHEEMKATCLWLRGLPELEYTDVVGPPPKDKRERRKWARVHQMSPGPRRWKARSKTYAGIAEAMAEQWGEHL